MQAVVLADFGSTFTKVTVVEEPGGRLLASAQSPTTVESDVMHGYETALAQAPPKRPQPPEDQRQACRFQRGRGPETGGHRTRPRLHRGRGPPSRAERRGEGRAPALGPAGRIGDRRVAGDPPRDPALLRRHRRRAAGRGALQRGSRGVREPGLPRGRRVQPGPRTGRGEALRGRRARGGRRRQRAARDPDFEHRARARRDPRGFHPARDPGQGLERHRGVRPHRHHADTPGGADRDAPARPRRRRHPRRGRCSGRRRRRGDDRRAFRGGTAFDVGRHHLRRAPPPAAHPHRPGRSRDALERARRARRRPRLAPSPRKEPLRRV